MNLTASRGLNSWFGIIGLAIIDIPNFCESTAGTVCHHRVSHLSADTVSLNKRSYYLSSCRPAVCSYISGSRTVRRSCPRAPYCNLCFGPHGVLLEGETIHTAHNNLVVAAWLIDPAVIRISSLFAIALKRNRCRLSHNTQRVRQIPLRIALPARILLTTCLGCAITLPTFIFPFCSAYQHHFTTGLPSRTHTMVLPELCQATTQAPWSKQKVSQIRLRDRYPTHSTLHLFSLILCVIKISLRYLYSRLQVIINESRSVT